MGTRSGEGRGDARPRVGDAGPRVGDAGPRVGDADPRVGDAGPRVGDAGPRVGDAAVEAILAGTVVGAIEALRIVLATGTHSLAIWSVIAAFATAGAIACAALMRAAFAGLRRFSRIALWVHDVAGGGPLRVIAVWRAVLVVTAAIAFGWVCFHTASWAHEAYRFNDGAPVGLLLAAIDTPIGAAVVAAALALDRAVVPRLAGARRATLDGRRAYLAGTLAILAVALGPLPIVHRAVPSIRLGAVLIASCTIAAVCLAGLLRLGARRAARRLALAVILAVVAAIAASVAVPEARRLIIEQGFASRVAARLLWSLADRDGDGYPFDVLGGADCDDTDPLRHPRAPDIAGNGRDENCTGADADPAAFGPRAAARPAAASPGPRSMLILSVDALRADHLGAWGYHRPTSPAIDRLAAAATRFSWALTSSPSTRHAIPSLHTGRHASNIPVDPPPPTLAERLRDAGWDTAAIMPAQRIIGARSLRGFTSVDISAGPALLARAGKANSDVVADLAISWLATRAANPTPFLLWLHLYDPHHPYTTPDGIPAFGDTDLDRYDAEIAFADRAIGRILDALDHAGLSTSTIVGLTADHGDEFNEHGIRFHARSLYNQVVRIPLVIRLPGAPPSVIDAPVSLVDVAPTLLDLVGQPGPAGMNGRSLAAAIQGTGPLPVGPVLLELTPDRTIHRDLVAIVSPPWKAIWDREANAWSLYALTDIADADDRSTDDPQALAMMQHRLAKLIDAELGALPAK